MRRRTLVLITAAVAAAVALVAALPGSAQTPKPVTLAVASDAFKITLIQGGKKVTKLKPGTYTFKLVDKTAIHNVNLLRGGKTVKDTKGAAVKTSVGGRAAKTVTVKLTKGTYKFQCDPHASSMNGTFTVG
jgi:plastocyanin